MRIAVDVDDGVLEAAIEAAARAGITAEKIVEEALRVFARVYGDEIGTMYAASANAKVS